MTDRQTEFLYIVHREVFYGIMFKRKIIVVLNIK